MHAAAVPLHRPTCLRRHVPTCVFPEGADPRGGGATGAALRRPPRACDQAITGTTRRWLRCLPPHRRPMLLCNRYPRVANRLAFGWDDATRSAALIDDLLEDRRGGRRGFPAGVVRELRRLRDFNLQQRVEPAGAGWWQRLGRIVGWD